MRFPCAVALMRRILDTPGTTWPRWPRGSHSIVSWQPLPAELVQSRRLPDGLIEVRTRASRTRPPRRLGHGSKSLPSQVTIAGAGVELAIASQPQRGGFGSGRVARRASTPATLNCNPLLNHASKFNHVAGTFSRRNVTVGVLFPHCGCLDSTVACFAGGHDLPRETPLD